MIIANKEAALLFYFSFYMPDMSWHHRWDLLSPTLLVSNRSLWDSAEATASESVLWDELDRTFWRRRLNVEMLGYQ